LTGFRGAPAGDIPAALDAILAIADFATENAETLCDLDVNPLLVLRKGEGVVAADALLRMAEPPEPRRQRDP
jgi:acetyl-CoA synthetase